MAKKPKKSADSGTLPPITKAETRNIKQGVRVLLAARSGGRCEFAGCNKYLFEHQLTLKDGNLSEHAHIVAFSKDGPRGRSGPRPRDLNSADNLMLLCAPDHKLIDDNPGDYPRELLEQYKREHEARIKHVTGLGPDMRTTVVQLKAKIAGSAVDIPAAHIYEAVAPRYPTDKQGRVIDITEYDREDRAEYYSLAKDKISKEVARIYDKGMDVEATRHISLFALAPIPVLAYLGHCLSNKITVEMYQRHRTGEPWKWKTDGEAAEYEIRWHGRGGDDSCAALIVSVSGSIDVTQLPREVAGRCSVYEIRVRGQTPNPDLLRQRDDLERFRTTYRKFLAELGRDQPQIKDLHIFPAVPAPIAVALGHDLLPKVHPALLLYDNDKNAGGFIRRLRINDNDKR